MSFLDQNPRGTILSLALLALILSLAMIAATPVQLFAALRLIAADPSAEVSNVDVFLIVAGVLVVFGSIFGVALLLSRRRVRARKELVIAGGAMGLALEPKDKGPAFLSGLSTNLLLQKRGVTRTAHDILRGSEAPGVITLFRFGYTNSYPAPRHIPEWFYQTVVALRFPAARLPQFHLAPRHWWNKIGKVLGSQAISFENRPEFSTRYVVWGADEIAVRNFFAAPLIGYFLSLPEDSTWHVEGADQWLLFYHADRVISAAELRSLWEEVATMAVNLADYGKLGRAV